MHRCADHPPPSAALVHELPDRGHFDRLSGDSPCGDVPLLPWPRSARARGKLGRAALLGAEHPLDRSGPLADDPRHLRDPRGACLQLSRRRPARRRRPVFEIAMSAAADTTVLSVENLSIALRQDRNWIPIVDDVSFAIGSGEVLALVGESGSGKSVTALSLMQLLSPGLSITGGRIMLNARDGFRGDIVALGTKG